MRQSHVIEISGHFAGAAVSDGSQYRFVAVDPRTEALDNTVWPSLRDVRRGVRHTLVTGRPPKALTPG